MNFLHEILMFGLDWMYVLLFSITVILLSGSFILSKSSYYHDKNFDFISMLGNFSLVAMVIIFVFSNRISSYGEEVAIHEHNEKLVLQKDPGVYIGIYSAYYFSKTPVTLCRNMKETIPFKKSTQECTEYVVNFERFASESDTLLLTGTRSPFSLSNFSGVSNTISLIQVLLELLGDKSNLPAYVTWKAVK